MTKGRMEGFCRGPKVSAEGKIMTLATSMLGNSNTLHILPIRDHVEAAIEELMLSLPDPERLCSEERRGIIARYASVLEGNFIYWMTATLLSVNSGESRSIVLENLRQEVRDCHPGMMRRFAVAAQAAPTDADARAVYRDLTDVRLFLGRLLGVQNLLTMGFFEGFIQRFMAYLGDLAQRQGSTDLEYTDVHGLCDITHTYELHQAIEAEMLLSPPAPETDLFEGVKLLKNLIHTIIHCESSQPLRVKSATSK